jgi:GNAT superfamily N-acetyltransferase
MAPTEHLSVIELDARHLAGALLLSKEAHWNQVEADWRMMMAAGTAIGMVAPDGRLVASALTLPHGDQFGWVSMVLVTAEWQKMGLATRLLKTCIEKLEGAGLIPVLDATADGQNVYRPLGFEPHFGITRWQREGIEVGTALNNSNIDPERVYRYDSNIFGGERRVILNSLIERSAGFSCVNNGYLLGRDGRIASQIGPIYADNPESALAMLDHALSNLQGRLFIDAADHQEEFVARLKEYGFEAQRPFLRMGKGRAEHFGDLSKMFAMAGPELG